MTTSTTDDGLVEHIMDLAIEVGNAADDGFILEQDRGSGERSRLYLQRLHVERLALHAGLLKPRDPRAEQYQKVIAMLVRRLRVLHGRIDELDDYLHKFSDTEHADLQWELTYSRATWSISNEFQVDLDDLARDSRFADGAVKASSEATNSGSNGVDAQFSLDDHR